MTPKEVFGEAEWAWIYQNCNYSKDRNTLYRYKNADCVIAHKTSDFGGIFVIKGEKQHFAFSYIKEIITDGYIGRATRRIYDLKMVLKCFEKDKHYVPFININEMNDFKSFITLKEL